MFLDMKELRLKLQYWVEYDKEEYPFDADAKELRKYEERKRKEAEKALEAVVSQVTHLTTFKLMAQKDFKVYIKRKAYHRIHICTSLCGRHCRISVGCIFFLKFHVK